MPCERLQSFISGLRGLLLGQQRKAPQEGCRRCAGLLPTASAPGFPPAAEFPFNLLLDLASLASHPEHEVLTLTLSLSPGQTSTLSISLPTIYFLIFFFYLLPWLVWLSGLSAGL